MSKTINKGKVASKTLAATITSDGVVVAQKAVPRLMTEKESYTVDYPEAIAFAKNQAIDGYWTEDEIVVEKDIQSVLVECTEAEKHGIITVLRLFTKYELMVGSEHWGDKIMKMFPRPDVQRMANAFSFAELNIHAPFYDKINKALNLSTDEFYMSYVSDKTLRSRMGFIDRCLNDSCPLFSLGTFAMIEGGVLYSNFAFLKHFQSQGKNKMTNIVAGINFSVRDENLHHLGGAWLFQTLAAEMQLSAEEQLALQQRLHEATDQIRIHEHRIVDMIFEKGEIEGITAKDMKTFIDSRLDLCLQNLGLPTLYNVAKEDNPIATWFYKGISSYIMHDFFNRVGNQYTRGWEPTAFVWLSESEKKRLAA